MRQEVRSLCRLGMERVWWWWRARRPERQAAAASSPPAPSGPHDADTRSLWRDGAAVAQRLGDFQIQIASTPTQHNRGGVGMVMRGRKKFRLNAATRMRTVAARKEGCAVEGAALGVEQSSQTVLDRKDSATGAIRAGRGLL